MTKQTWRILAGSAIPFVIIVLVLWAIGFFDLSTDTKVVGSALALIGGLVTSVVTLFGLFLKQSMEQRNADLRDDAEKRLKLEAGIKAVSLLGTQAGDDSSITQRTGALFTMAHLGLIDLAIDLVRLMRPKGLIEATAASSLLDMALKSNDSVLQRSAADYLGDHSDTLLTESGLEWPNSATLKWPDKFGYLIKDALIRGIMKAILARKYYKWDPEQLVTPILYLINGFRAEKDPRLKSNITVFLQEILNIYKDKDIYGDRVIVQLPKEDMKIDMIHEQVLKTDISNASTKTLDLADTVKSWLVD